MATATRENGASTDLETRREAATEAHYEQWHHWPVNWSAIWVGTLAAMTALLLFGLIGVAVGAHVSDPQNRWVDLKKVQIGALIFSVCSAFFSFVIGGWVSGKVAGILRSEPGILHGAIVWLVAVPLLLLFGALGASSLFGGWYAGLAGSPSGAAASATPFDRPDPLGASATEAERTEYQAAMSSYHTKVNQWREETPRVTRNTALGTLTALLLGLVGSVLGGWWASGEPMTFSSFRNRNTTSARTVRI